VSTREKNVAPLYRAGQGLPEIDCRSGDKAYFAVEWFSFHATLRKCAVFIHSIERLEGAAEGSLP
jgi:hypothetical protein